MSEPQTVALVLGSGGARGYAHIGVIEVLREQGYNIVAISGASMGALIGGMYAAGKLQAYKDWVTGLDQLQLLRLLDFSLGSPGAIRGEKVFGVVQEMLGGTCIEELDIPFTAVATDLLAHQEVWFQEGPMHQAVRASTAIPSVITPVMLQGRVLVDGGLLNPLPIIPTVAAHADLTLAVNLSGTDKRYANLPPLEEWASRERKQSEAAAEAAAQAAADEEVDPAEEADASPDEWLDGLKQRAARWFDWDNQETEGRRRSRASSEEQALMEVQKRHAHESGAGAGNGQDDARAVSLQELGLGKFDVMNLAIETMQDSLTRYKIAGYPPDILINLPKHVCRSFDYHRAPELIQLGRMLAEDALEDHRNAGKGEPRIPGSKRQ